MDDKSITKLVAGTLATVFIAAAGFGSFYSVNPSEMANVRRLGSVVNTEPVSPGPHFKVPFIDTVDHLQVSLTTLHIPPFTVNTIDNQQITLDLNFNFTIPRDKVNHLLYEVGKSGSFDISESIIPIVKDRAGRVFNVQNTTTLSQNRDAIQAEVTKSVFETVKTQFGIEPHTLQFAQIGYSPAFVSSNERAVTAKNDAIAEQNKQVVETAKAAQLVIQAKAKADSAIEDARGASESVLLNAKANKTKAALDGMGENSRLKAEIAALGGNSELYVKYLQAKAGLNWDGKLPQVQGGAGSSTNIVVPVPKM